MTEFKIDKNRYITQVRDLIKRDEPKNAVVFYGSSTFTGWGHEKLKEDMAPITVVNRGFGGSVAHEAAYYYEELVKPLEPKVLVWYEGDNDVSSGYSPDEVLEITKNLFDTMRKDFTDLQIVVLSVKKSPRKEEWWAEMDEYNAKLKKYAEGISYIRYADMNSFTFDENNNARKDIYEEDMLHYNDLGESYLTDLIKPMIKKALED